MPRLKKHRGGNGYHDDSDSISEISHDDSSIQSGMSRSSAFRSKLGKFGKKVSGVASVGSASKGSGSRRTPIQPVAAPPPPRDTASVTSANSAGNKIVDKKRHMKDARSRFNIGLVYLKTGDYAKAQENLEHALFCHIQLSGHDAKRYDNDAIFSIAGVREKLGDCYVANKEIVDKALALDHFEESRRLLKSVDPEDAPANLTEMLQRVEEKLKSPELRSTAAKKKQPPPSRRSDRYQMEGNDKAKVVLGVGAAGVSAAPATKVNARKPSPKRRRAGSAIVQKMEAIPGVGKGFGVIHGIAHEVGEGLKEVTEGIMDIIDDSSSDDTNRISRRETDAFAEAVAHVDRDNHRTAFNRLISLQEGGGMKNDGFRHQMAQSMLMVAESAKEANKINIAIDAYEEALTLLKQDDATGEDTKIAMKGCIRCHKLMAMEMEDINSYGSAISHRSRVYQLLDEDNRAIPACQQQVMIAHHHIAKEEYAKSAVVLSEASRRLHKGVRSIDDMASDRRDLLIQCHQMQAICYNKSKKWNDALEQYDKILPLVAKREGQGGKEYNSALIHKSALLVGMGNHRLAGSSVNKYLKLAELSDPNLIVDELDHVLALDTCAATHLKMGNVDKAISIFERKLAFVKTLPNNDGMKSDTMHKLGCLLANKNEPKAALPLLDEAQRIKKFVYDGKHKSVLETTWAVAATNHTLGDNDKALKEYSVLLDKMANIEDMPVDAVVIHNSAGKLFFEDGKLDKAVQFFRQALHEAETAGNLQLKSEITLNLANALSARGEGDKAMELYGKLLKTKQLKKTKISFLTRFNKSLLLIKMGELEKAKEILHKIVETRSPTANGVKGNIFLTLGNLAISEGNVDEALDYFGKSLDVAGDEDFSARADAMRSIALAQLRKGEPDKAIAALEDVLEDLLNSDVVGNTVNLLTAEIWNCMSYVYRKVGDLGQAKNFAKLALQTYKADLGETNPVTLRNVSNLQLILLEEAEGLEKSEAKSIIDAAKFEMEETLEAFVSFDDPWTYRLDVASLKTNLGLVAIWQGKPKKARKLVRQIKEIELPSDHPLEHRVAVLEERLGELEKKKN